MPTNDRNFELGLLPERKWDWRTFATSYGFVSGLVLLLICFGIILPDTMLVSPNFHVTELVARPPLRPEALPKPRQIRAKLLPPVPVIQTPKLVVPSETRIAKQQPQEIEPPKVVVNNFAPAVLKMTSGARPVLVHTGDFQGSSAAPTLNASPEKVQTGGFGDPNGLKPSEHSKPGGKLIASTNGSFDLPIGAGEGNGSGGAKGLKGTVASADFGNGVATAGQGDGRKSGHGGSVKTSGFGTQEVAQNVPHAQRMDVSLTSNAVEITYKPNPVYTDDARAMRLEGEVLVEVEFSANGQLHVNRIVRGLGHGLDEAAVAAANKMRFKAALRNGQAVDSTAVVHVVFALAY